MSPNWTHHPTNPRWSGCSIRPGRRHARTGGAGCRRLPRALDHRGVQRRAQDRLRVRSARIRIASCAAQYARVVAADSLRGTVVAKPRSVDARCAGQRRAQQRAVGRPSTLQPLQAALRTHRPAGSARRSGARWTPTPQRCSRLETVARRDGRFAGSHRRAGEAALAYVRQRRNL